MIEVDAENGKTLIVFRRPLERYGKALVEGGAIRQFGQRIVVRHMRYALLGALSFRHIFQQAEKILWLSVIVPDGDFSGCDDAGFVVEGLYRVFMHEYRTVHLQSLPVVLHDKIRVTF